MASTVADSYDAFAPFYDLFTANDDYGAWFQIIEELVCRYGDGVPATAWDIGTGTGKMAEKLAGRGLHVIGTDVSRGMLELARRRLGSSECDFFLSDVRTRSIAESVDLVTAIDDVLNYMTSEAELRSALGNVKKGLNVGGLFIFDLNVRRTYHRFFSETNVIVVGLNEIVTVSRPIAGASKSAGDYQLLIEAFFREGDSWVVRSTVQRQHYFHPKRVESLLQQEGFVLCGCYALSRDGELVSDLDEDKYFKYIYVVRSPDDDA